MPSNCIFTWQLPPLHEQISSQRFLLPPASPWGTQTFRPDLLLYLTTGSQPELIQMMSLHTSWKVHKKRRLYRCLSFLSKTCPSSLKVLPLLIKSSSHGKKNTVWLSEWGMDFKRLIFLRSADMEPPQPDSTGTEAAKVNRRYHFLMLYLEWFILENNNTQYLFSISVCQTLFLVLYICYVLYS